MTSEKRQQYERAVELALVVGALNRNSHNAYTPKIAQSLVALLQYADRLHRYSETACNYELTAAQEKRVEGIERRVTEICRELGVGVKFNSDPRGYAVKLLLPDGSYNTWGGKEEGWGI